MSPVFSGRRMPSRLVLCPGGFGRRTGFVLEMVLTWKMSPRGARESTPGGFHGESFPTCSSFLLATLHGGGQSCTWWDAYLYPPGTISSASPIL